MNIASTMLWSKASVALACFAAASRSSVHAFAPRLITVRSYATTRLAAASTQYILTYDYIPDVLEKRGPYRAEHLQLAADAVTDGTCLHGGPKAALEPGSPPNGALFIFTSAQAAEDFVDKDPYVSGGIVTSHTIEEWTVAVSKDA